MKPVETMTDAEVREELAAEGVDVDAAKARFMPKLDDLMRARAVRLSLASLKANPLSKDPPRWAPFDEYTCAFIRNPYGGHVAQFRTNTERDYALAAVNAAPVLAAEVERLQGLLAAARVAVEKWPHTIHGRIKEGVPGTLYLHGLPQCPATYGRTPCECGADETNAARTAARRAVGLEG